MKEKIVRKVAFVFASLFAIVGVLLIWGLVRDFGWWDALTTAIVLIITAILGMIAKGELWRVKKDA